MSVQSQTTLARVDGQVEIIAIDDRNFGEWVEAEVAVDGVRCLPFQFTKRVWHEIRSNEEKLMKFLYQFGRSMNQKCGTYKNPLPQRAVEEAA
jgi:hypothetical protein